MKIYTGRGDEGQTDLRDMSRVSKASTRIEAYGTVDEVNALVGAVRPTGHDDIDDCLREVQNHLHIAQADFANPDPDEDDPAVAEEQVENIDDRIDETYSLQMPADLPAGDYRLVVGWYQPASGERVLLENGADTLELARWHLD
jgi:ATP:cob(I)alamin adenosyltransferase